MVSELGKLALQAVLSFIATSGFAVLYNVPRYALVWCSTIGMGAYLVQSILRSLGVAEAVAIFFGSLFVGLVGAVPARQMHLPVVMFAITGIICIVPGTSVYKVLLYFHQNDILGGLKSAVEAGFGIGAIATGIGAARILTDAEWGFERDRN